MSRGLRALRPLIVLGLMAAFVASPIGARAVKPTSSTSNTGALYTTNHPDCTDTNDNIYADRGVVHLRGQNLPDGKYYVQVTDPSGNTVLGSSVGTTDPTPVTVTNGTIDDCPRLWSIVNSASSGYTVKGYDASPNGEYKAWIAMDSAFESQKTDNFKVEDSECVPPAEGEGCVTPPPPHTVHSLTLSQAADHDPVNTDHTVTAHAADENGDPFPGANVRFEVWRSGSQVTAGPGTAPTDANGDTSFTYHGPTSAAVDTIIACTNSDGSLPSSCTDSNGTVLTSVVSATTTKTWVEGPPAATFSCRASVLRGEGAVLGILGEPFVANSAGNPCATDNNGLLKPFVEGGVPGSEGDIVLAGPPGTGSITLGVANAKTHRNANEGDADAYVVRLRLEGMGHFLEVDVLRSASVIECAGGNPFVAGKSAVVLIDADGNATPTTDPQDIPLGPLGTLHLNYGHTDTSGGNVVHTQRAVWLEGSPLGDLIVSEAIADAHGNPCAS